MNVGRGSFSSLVEVVDAAFGAVPCSAVVWSSSSFIIPSHVGHPAGVTHVQAVLVQAMGGGGARASPLGGAIVGVGFSLKKLNFDHFS